MATYYDFFSTKSFRNEPIISIPYIDAFGTGKVVTVEEVTTVLWIITSPWDKWFAVRPASTHAGQSYVTSSESLCVKLKEISPTAQRHPNDSIVWTGAVIELTATMIPSVTLRPWFVVQSGI